MVQAIERHKLGDQKNWRPNDLSTKKNIGRFWGFFLAIWRLFLVKFLGSTVILFSFVSTDVLTFISQLKLCDTDQGD